MNETPFLSDPEILVLKEHVCAALERFSPQLLEAGRRLLDRLATPNWTLEWYLPRWLGEAFGLSPDLIRDLVLSNVYGLSCIRLQDDLVDGEVDRASWESAILLASALHHLWLSGYVQLFAGTSPFWGYFEQFMGQWLRATWRSNRPPAVDFRSYEEEDFLRLAERGAPLKVCCAGACLLAGREELILPLTSAMDHFLVGAVLLDQAKDWADDLEAGRYNVFVAYASPQPQEPDRRESYRQAVLEEICLGQAARPYFDRIQRHVRIALEKAEAVDCPALRQHMQSFENQVVTIRDRLAEEARAWLRMATEQLFGLSPAEVPAIPEEGR
ncbi:MAG: hypothetical protein QHJ81_03040 [Anaerolineae bacterium]|nr:hypothetical protein [Anaerolineae bacterium]